jgi:glycosidase
VATGTEIRLGVSVIGLSAERVFVSVLDGNRQSDYELFPDGELYSGTFRAADRPTVLWYWFEVRLTGGAVVYYGAEVGDNAGIGRIFNNAPPAFQITVHDSGFKTPDWAKGAVLYQVFPDRLRRGNPAAAEAGLAYHHSKGRKAMFLHERWEEQPAWQPFGGMDYYEPLDFFGGDLAGIREELPRLAQLGVRVVYLNPIFEAASNHRYNTADYRTIDPVLGTEEDFAALVTEAERLGIHLLLDGVFSHTGDDSVYFNKYGHYDSLGAYQSTDSPYFSWYKFKNFPDSYECWWGFGSLPEVNERDPSWVYEVIEGEQSVFRTWLRKGASGYRLDVADELPDETIEKMRGVMKAEKPESFLLGEVWEDATTKQSYNIGRQYALGRGLDSVMNYPFSVRTINFLLGRENAFSYRRFLVSQNQNYPKEMVYTLMNLLSSHDAARIRTVLATGLDGRNLSKEAQAAFGLTEEADKRGAALQRLAAAIQFSLPGMPAIYYGDETGMTGFLDPFNRAPYQVRDTEMTAWYKRLSDLRNAQAVLRTGHAIFYSTDGNVLGILRYAFDGEDAFGAPAEDAAVLTLINPKAETHRIVIDLFSEKDCQQLRHRQRFCDLEWQEARSLCSDLTLPIKEGLIDIALDAYGCQVFSLTWK